MARCTNTVDVFLGAAAPWRTAVPLGFEAGRVKFCLVEVLEISPLCYRRCTSRQTIVGAPLFNPAPSPVNARVGILVNLGGYAGTAKSADIFALRPAPVAVSYMGFPGTMGSVEMVDYILADGVVIPPDLKRFYSEKVTYKPVLCS